MVFDHRCLRRRQVSCCEKCLRFERCSKTMKPLETPEIVEAVKAEIKIKKNKKMSYGRIPKFVKKDIYNDLQSGHFYKQEIMAKYNISYETLKSIEEEFMSL